MSDLDIKEPYGITDTPLVLILSGSPVYRETLMTYLIDFEYRVAGPFENVDGAHAFIRRQVPDLIIFDAMTSQSELIAFSQLLRSDINHLPVLVLHHGDSFSINHHTIDFIYPPLNPVEIEQKISGLLNDEDEETVHPVIRFTDFMNRTILKLIELSPEFGKVDMEDILQNSITTLTVRNSALAKKSSESLLLQIPDPNNVELELLTSSFKLLLEEVIENVNERLETEWGESLVEDALEAVTIELRNLGPAAVKVVEDMGKGYEKVIRKFKHAVPELEEVDKNLIVAKLLLTDWGPELKDVITTDESMENRFDDGIASQLITLVGQGSQYHQGIFGPVPVPKTEDIIAIIWSKLIKSDIQDQRMGGNTLIIIAVGFKQSIVNNIPSLDKIKKIFSELDKKTHEKEINKLSLEKVAAQFRGLII